MAVPGRKVELHSLQAKPHLNGKRGVVAGAETQTGRVPVRVDGEEITQALKYNNLKWDVGEEAIAAAAVCGGKLAEDEGRCFSTLLDMGRVLVNENYHRVVKDLRWESDGLHRLRQSPEGLKKIKLLTSQMYSFWTRANGMPVLGLLRDWIDQNCARAVNPHTREVTGGGPKGQLKWLQAASLDREVARWGDENSRITGDFWVVEQRDDGAVLVSRTQQGLVCLGLGIADSICKVLPPTSYANPVCVHLTLLPFKRRLVYDGVLHAIACGDSPRDLEERVMKAEASGAVVRCIPYPPAETQEDRQRLQAAGSLPTKSDEGVAEQVRTQYRELLAQLAALPRSTPPTSENAPDPGSWVLRRMGYSEEGNPNHMGMIMAGSGLVLGPFFCAALEPTPEELLQAVVETAVRVGRRPWCVMIDAESAVQRVQQVLEQADVKVAYYPPPSQEEQDAIQNF